LNSKSEHFYSNGKLLLTGEYLVLDGALSLAVPTKFGQSMDIQKIEDQKIVWNSLDDKGKVWFKDVFLISDIVTDSNGHQNDISNRLLQILKTAKKQNPNFLADLKGYNITTKLGFPKNWGLGTSSTLINNIANWAKVDAYELLEKTFGGSGYDIACAHHNTPILYQRIENNPTIKEVSFEPLFKDCLYFVYLNKKQNSRNAIATYRDNSHDLSVELLKINDITKKMVSCTDFTEFQKLINFHETILSRILHQQPIKEKLFSDFEGSIKSLGAWGGDFVMVVSKKNPSDYFKSKGFETLLTYDDMVK